jgi:homoserine dehydrogenase
MDQEGASFEGALKEAQELGYAERNPEADVEGHDTCRKIAILTAMVTGKEVNFEDIYTEGITKITDVDFRYAEKMGTSVKLFGCSEIEADIVHAWVAPVMIGKSHPLYTVSDVYNGVLVKSNMLGDSMYYGSGAGKLPTASAVVADIIEIVQNADHNVALGWSSDRQTIAPMETSAHRYFVRVAGKASEKLTEVHEAFGDVKVVELEGMDEFAVLTGKLTEADYKTASKALDIVGMIRAEIE